MTTLRWGLAGTMEYSYRYTEGPRGYSGLPVLQVIWNSRTYNVDPDDHRVIRWRESFPGTGTVSLSHTISTFAEDYSARHDNDWHPIVATSPTNVPPTEEEYA